MKSTDLLFELLSIDSPTFNEKEKADFLSRWASEHLSKFDPNALAIISFYQHKIIVTHELDLLATWIMFLNFCPL